MTGRTRRTRCDREHTLALEAAPLREVVRWASRYERLWTERLDRLEAPQPSGPWFGCHRVILNPRGDGLFYLAVKHEDRIWPHDSRFVPIDRPAPRRVEYTFEPTAR